MAAENNKAARVGHETQKAKEDTKPEYQTVRIASARNQTSAHTLIIDHIALRQGLLALPDPAPSTIVGTLAAADLLAVAGGTRYDFGRAAGGIPAKTGFTHQALAIEDETFRVAHQVIGDPYAEEQRPDHKSHDSHEAARALMEDHVLGNEFYLQLVSLLQDAPAEISYGSGEDVF
jgi:hypothetical protein